MMTTSFGRKQKNVLAKTKWHYCIEMTRFGWNLGCIIKTKSCKKGRSIKDWRKKRRMLNVKVSVWTLL